MKIKVNDIVLAYECCGEGDPMLLLHGNGENHRIFDKLAAKLKAHFTIYAIDSRNHGDSTYTNDYSYLTMAEDVDGFIAALRLGKVNIIGFSDGAIISLLLAMGHGAVIKKMALLGVNLSPDDFTAECHASIRQTYEETGDPLFKLMLEEPNIDLHQLREIAIPTLLVAGEHDIYRAALYTELVETIPDAQLIVMRGHDHDSYVTGQDILYNDFIRFFC